MLLPLPRGQGATIAFNSRVVLMCNSWSPPGLGTAQRHGWFRSGHVPICVWSRGTRGGVLNLVFGLGLEMRCGVQPKMALRSSWLTPQARIQGKTNDEPNDSVFEQSHKYPMNSLASQVPHDRPKYPVHPPSNPASSTHAATRAHSSYAFPARPSSSCASPL